MILDKNLLINLLNCNTSNGMCKFGMHILKYIYSLNNNKITSTKQCPIFFSNDRNNKANLKPYVLNYFYELGKYHGSISLDKSQYYSHNNEFFVSFDNYRKNGYSRYVMPDTYIDVVYNLINYKYNKIKKTTFINDVKPLINYLKNSNYAIDIYKLLYFGLIDTINEPLKTEIRTAYDTILYLFQRDLLYLLSNMMYDFFIRKIYNNEDNLYTNYYLKYTNLYTKYYKLLFLNDNRNAKFNATVLNNNESEFMNFFVPLIDVSIINKIYYFDKQNKSREFTGQVKETILKTIYLHGFNSIGKR